MSGKAVMSSDLSKYVVVDVETTGFGRNDRIVEIAAVTLDPSTWESVDEFDTLINPERDVGPVGVHGINAGMVEAAPTFSEIVPAIAARLQGAVLVAHNLVFDTRMLRQEFDRRGVTVDLGYGFCTYEMTGMKLFAACGAFDIPLSQQHRALADARATAELARRLRPNGRTIQTKAASIGAVPPAVRHHTLRRGLADAGISPMHRIVSCADLPKRSSAVQQYLDMLDWALDDGVIDPQERSQMSELASDLGISERARQNAHRAYLDCIIRAAERDGVISQAENDLIVQIAVQLGVGDASIPEVTPVASIENVAKGSRVCFTGTPNKARLEALARQAGFVPVKTVSKKGCDVLVAADASTSSGKARNARKWDIPIVPVHEFLGRFDQN